MRRRFGRRRNGSGPWQWFLVALLFLVAFPLFPIGAEALFAQQVHLSSLALVTSTYAISLAMSSRNLLVWALGLIIGMGFAVMFGWAMGVGDDVIGPAWRHPPGGTSGSPGVWSAGLALATTFLLHIFERFFRHVVDGEPFPEFLKEVRWRP